MAEESEQAHTDGKRKQYLTWAVVCLMGTYIAFRTLNAIAHAWPFITDDAFISLRYAQNLVDGHGLVFNPGGERVEGYSNFLIVLVAAGAKTIGIDPVAVIRLLSCVALAGTSVFSYLLARRWVEPVVALVPAYVMTAYFGTILWTVSGLETAIFQCLSLAVVWVGFQIVERLQSWGEHHSLKKQGFYRWCSAFGVLALLTAVTRPEGPLVGLITAMAIAYVAITKLRFEDGNRSPEEDRSLYCGMTIIGVLFVGLGCDPH